MENATVVKEFFNGTLKKVVLGVLVLLGLFLLMLSINQIQVFGRDGLTYANSITVEGEGKVVIIPDVAKISFSVTESKPTVAEAQAAANEKINKALEALKGLGVEEKDLETQNYAVYPKYEYQQPCYGQICPAYTGDKIVGYEVSQSVEVKVRDTGKAGDALSALGAIGVQNIQGPAFVLDDESEAKNQARLKAIEDAKKKAEQLAKGLGVRLGKVTSFYEPGPADMYGYGGGFAGAEMAKTASPALPVGERETTMRVSVTFEIH